VLKAYMHGYFMELKAYQRLLSIADPFAYEKYRQEQIKTRVAQQRQRIQVSKKPNASSQVAVNQALRDELLPKGDGDFKKGDGKKLKDGERLLQDDRFASLFTDKDFARDRNSENYKAIKTTDGKRGDSSEDEDAKGEQPTAAKTKLGGLNSLFGKGSDDEEDADGKPVAFSDKLTKQERKMFKKRVQKDKITGSQQPRVLTGGVAAVDRMPAKHGKTI